MKENAGRIRNADSEIQSSESALEPAYWEDSVYVACYAYVDTATWQVFNELDWSSIIRLEIRSPVGRLSKLFSEIPVVEVPDSIPVRSQFGLCGGHSTLKSNTRDIASNCFPSLLHLS